MAHSQYKGSEYPYVDHFKQNSTQGCHSEHEFRHGQLCRSDEPEHAEYTVHDECDEEEDDDHHLEDESNIDLPWSGSMGKTSDLFFLKPQDPPQVESTQHMENGETVAPPDGNEPERKVFKKKTKGLKGSAAKKPDSGKPPNNHVTSNPSNSHSVGVKFNDMPTGVNRQLTLHVDPYRHNYGRRATLCETLFGIVPGHFNSKLFQSNGLSHDDRIMVQGLLPGGEAFKAGIKIGEWMMAVDDTDVSFSNIDAFLSSITGPQQVILTLQKIAIQASPKVAIARKACMNTKLVRVISGDNLRNDTVSLDNEPIIVLYLTLTGYSEDMREKEDVLYQFPRADTKLVDIRGMFITLTHLLVDVTNNTAKNSTLLVDGRLFNVAYSLENRDVLVLGMPADRMSLPEVNHVMNDVVRVVKVMCGSFYSAFSNEENHSRLDHLFHLVFQRCLFADELLQQGANQTKHPEPFLELLTGVRALTLPEETKVTINNCMSEFEAADFADMADVYYDIRRSYVILGTCTFYKGYLLSSHLHKEDLQDVTLYLRHHCLLTLCQEQQLGQLTAWREVFPTRRCHFQADPLIPGFTEPEARWFLLVVGMRNALLGVLLEAAGCAAWADGQPTPDPFYVDQAQATLLQMESLDVFNQADIRLSGPPVPSIACADWFFATAKGGKDDHATQNKVQISPRSGNSPVKKNPESILKKRTTPSPQMDKPKSGRGVVSEIDSDQDNMSAATSEGSYPLPESRGRNPSLGSDESVDSGGSASLFKASKKRRNLLSMYDVTGLKRSLSELAGEEGSHVKLTSGCDNTLFHYIQLDLLEGVYICPTQQELSQVISSTHARVLRNFHQACLSIHDILVHSQKVQTMREEGNVCKFGLDESLSNVTEHGILFQCTPESWTDSKKSPPTLNYWVVGRLLHLPYPREFYVCFQDSAQQSLVEMAFKLGFGLIV